MRDNQFLLYRHDGSFSLPFMRSVNDNAPGGGWYRLLGFIRRIGK